MIRARHTLVALVGIFLYFLAAWGSAHESASGSAILLAVVSIFGLGAAAYLGWGMWSTSVITLLASVAILLVAPNRSVGVVLVALAFALTVSWWSGRTSRWPLSPLDAFMPIVVMVLVSLNLSAMLSLRAHAVTTHSVYALVILYLATPPWEWAVSIATLVQCGYLAQFIRERYRLHVSFLRNMGLGILVGVGMIFLTAVIVSLETQGFHIHVVANNPFVTTPGLRNHRILPALLVGIGVIILAPIAEEALFRGVLFSTLSERWGYALGSLVSAAIFGLAHLDMTLFVPLAVAGLVLNALYRSTKSLVPGTFAHMTLNAISVITSLGILR